MSLLLSSCQQKEQYQSHPSTNNITSIAGGSANSASNDGTTSTRTNVAGNAYPHLANTGSTSGHSQVTPIDTTTSLTETSQIKGLPINIKNSITEPVFPDRFGCQNIYHDSKIKCVFLINKFEDTTYFQGGPTCFRETESGEFSFYSNADRLENSGTENELEPVTVKLPYFKSVELEKANLSGYKKAKTLARLANDESDCEWHHFYSRDSNRVKYFFQASDFGKNSFFNSQSYNNVINLMNKDSETLKSTYNKMYYYEKCNEVPNAVWLNQDIVNWVLYLNPQLNQESECSQYRRTDK